MSKINIFFSGVFTGALIIYITVTLVLVLAPKEPSALAVYKGKTCLEITYRDGVPVDSVVVFK